MNLEEILQGSLAPAEKESSGKGPRKTSDKISARKQSALAESKPSGPRRKFDKSVLLQRFQLTQELDMGVFEQSTLLDHCDLFVS